MTRIFEFLSALSASSAVKEVVLKRDNSVHLKYKADFGLLGTRLFYKTFDRKLLARLVLTKREQFL